MYTFKIDDFEGPLYLLLHLIKESKMDIFNVKLEVIIDEYLDYINKQEQMNLNISSSYLVMAAELIEIKSKMLLPRHNEDDEEEEIDPREALIERLTNYERYKELSETFKDLEEERHQVYTKTPESLKEFFPEMEVVNNSDVTLDDLLEAFRKFLERKKQNRPLSTKVTKKGITVEQRRQSIKKVLKDKGKVNFLELFDEITKEYVVVTFLAILEMAKKSELKINTSTISCFFKKTEKSKLLFLCLAAEEGNYSLGDLTEEITKNDINIKYNFIIQPMINNETYSISGQGSYILTAYPMVFNFTSIPSNIFSTSLVYPPIGIP